MSTASLSIKKIFFLIISLAVHLFAMVFIIYLTLPIARWYLEIKPARGIDLYLSASYVAHLLKNFAWHFNGWKEIWFSGVPYAKDYPFLYFYLMIPFAKHFGLIGGIQMFAVAGLFTFACFSYLLYHELSQNRVLAIILSLATLFSVNLYRTLVWAGGVPFWTTQAFYPIVIFLLAKFCRTQNYKWFCLSVIAAGLGIMGHPQNFFNLILPAAVFILFFWQPGEKKTRMKKRFLDLFTYGGLVYLVALPQISQLFTLSSLFAALINKILSPLNVVLPATTGGTSMPSETDIAIADWTESQVNLIWTDSHQILWYLLAAALVIFVCSLFLRKKRLKAIVSLIPFGLIVALVIGSVFLFSRGIDLYISGWYKAFWPVLVGVATLIAFLWGDVKRGLAEREFWQKKAVKVAKSVVALGVNLALIWMGYYFLASGPEAVIKKLEKIDQFSSAFPEILNVKTSEEDLLAIKDQLKPNLMVDDPKDYRLYVIDATVNIWWGAFQGMPLTRGYVDPPLTTLERWGIFWLDSALGPTDAGPKSSLIEDWHTPEEVADNNVRFLLDWYATKYLEGDHLSASNSHFASNITRRENLAQAPRAEEKEQAVPGEKGEVGFIEAEEKIETQGGIVSRYMPEERWSDDSPQYMKFYRVKSDLVSPILMAADSTPILHVGDETGYDSLTRFLGEVNLGPRKVVLARGPKYVDQLSFSDLTNFEAIILYKYDYGNYDKTWRLIGQYVEKGGKVFIDTGPEVKESDTTILPKSFPKELPGIFPFKRAVREDLGQYWEPEAAKTSATEGIDFEKFSPLIFDSGVWNVSHPISDDDIREDTRVILRHRGIPVVMEKTMGKGKVIWAGFNLPYHAIRDYNPEEAKFFQNLLSELVPLKENKVLAKGSFLSPRERIIDVNGGKGIVFKEQGFDGWKASLGRKNLKIYKVGPSSPGFMYVRLPEGASGQVRFKYVGSSTAKFQSAISTLVIIFILDYLLGGRVLIALARRVATPIRKKLGKWWEKEDEY